LAKTKKQSSTTTGPTPAITPRLLDVEKAATYLGTTTWCVRKLAWAKDVPHIKLGKKIVFDIVDLDAFIARAKTGKVYGTACNAAGVARA